MLRTFGYEKLRGPRVIRPLIYVFGPHFDGMGLGYSFLLLWLRTLFDISLCFSNTYGTNIVSFQTTFVCSPNLLVGSNELPSKRLFELSKIFWRFMSVPLWHLIKPKKSFSDQFWSSLNSDWWWKIEKN